MTFIVENFIEFILPVTSNDRVNTGGVSCFQKKERERKKNLVEPKGRGSGGKAMGVGVRRNSHPDFRFPSAFFDT